MEVYRQGEPRNGPEKFPSIFMYDPIITILGPLMPESNTTELFESAVGKKIIGVLLNFSGAPQLAGDQVGNRTYIFDDGSGLTFRSNGAFWGESRKSILGELRRRRSEAERLHKASALLETIESLEARSVHGQDSSSG